MNYEFVSIFLFVFSQFIATNRDNLGNLHFFYGLQLVLLAHGSHVLYMTNFFDQDNSIIYDRMEPVSHAGLGVSMFNPTREHDTNPTLVFSG